MRLKTNMIKGKVVYGFLVPILAVGMVVSPFTTIERAEASSITKVWVELSDASALNSTSTPLIGGVDTITVTFPDRTVAMGAPAGQQGL